ncbi:MAG: radical SAM protein [Spirochaetes bacterium]|nr:radical SAM protein [Spirochaetota bacterium]
MRVLLINTNRFKQPVPVIPIGMCFVAAATEKAGHQVKFLDLCFSLKPEKEISNVIESFKPDVVGLGIRNIDDASGYNLNFFLNDVRDKIINPLKKIYQGTIVLGGPSIGINAEEILNFFDLGYAIKGDGEEAFLEFLDNINSNRSLSKTGGLVIRKNNKIITDNAPKFVKDLNCIPFSNPQKYFDLTPYKLYKSPLLIQTKRGCALKCTYCTYNRIEGNEYRLKDPENIVNELEKLVSITGINKIEFVDSTFNIPLDHAKNILKIIIRKKLKLKLSTLGINPGAIDEEFADLLKKSGFVSISVALESCSDTTLKTLGKNFKVDNIFRTAGILHRKRIPVQWFLLLGAPGETEQTLFETFKNVKKIASPWDLINIGVGIRVYNGAPIANDLKKKNPGCTDDNFFKPFSYNPNNISLDKINFLTKIEFFKQHNILLFHERTKLPLFFRYLFTKFFPDQPVWKLYLIKRLIAKIFGVLFIKRFLFNKKNKSN